MMQINLYFLLKLSGVLNFYVILINQLSAELIVQEWRAK